MKKCEQCGKVEKPKTKGEDAGFQSALASIHEYRMREMRQIGDREFCSTDCKEKWIEEYGVFSYETDIKFILSFDVLIVPTGRSLPDPQADVKILINTMVKSIKYKDPEPMALGFDMEKNEFMWDGEVIKFANGEEMIERVRGALKDKF